MPRNEPRRRCIQLTELGQLHPLNDEPRLLLLPGRVFAKTIIGGSPNGKQVLSFLPASYSTSHPPFAKRFGSGLICAITTANYQPGQLLSCP